MRRDIIYTVITNLILMALFSMPVKIYAQQHAQAIMEVRANVVHGTKTIIPDEANIVFDSKQNDNPVSLGVFNIQMPDGTDYIVRHQSVIELKGSNNNGSIQTTMNKTEKNNNLLTLEIETVSSKSGLPRGQYLGNYTTRIEYY